MCIRDRFLGRILPTIQQSWWDVCVLQSLSSRQRQLVEREETPSLDALDLAALLRVLDSNWYQVSTSLELPREARHFVKEMHTVRNRWAHPSGQGIAAEDAYRDLDTLQRFASTIGADESFVAEVRRVKLTMLETTGDWERSALSRDSASTAPPSEDANEITVGEVVSLRSDPSVRGVVTSVMPGGAEIRYGVFLDGEEHSFYASQVRVAKDKRTAPVQMPYDELRSYLTALQVKHPGLSTLYSLNSARISFIPYQFRPVLKFIRSDRPRLLLADSVGVGKTIEAGLILRELEARRDINSMLVICPRPLVVEKKWEIEMKRFGSHLLPLDGAMLRMCIKEMDLEGEWPEQYRKIILPYSLFDESLLHGVHETRRPDMKLSLIHI